MTLDIGGGNACARILKATVCAESFTLLVLLINLLRLLYEQIIKEKYKTAIETNQQQQEATRTIEEK